MLPRKEGGRGCFLYRWLTDITGHSTPAKGDGEMKDHTREGQLNPMVL